MTASTLERSRHKTAPTQPSTEEKCEELARLASFLASITHGAVMSDAAYESVRCAGLYIEKMLGEQS